MFSHYLGALLSRSHEMEDITADYPELEFDYIGIREGKATINLIALVTADDLNEKEILSKIRGFYDYINSFRKDLLFNKIYKPNGVICFIFEDKKCAYRLRKFIPKQSLIDHTQRKGRVVVPWLINVKEKEIIPHKRMVSKVPPTCILHNPPLGVYPGLDAIDKLLRTYHKAPNSNSQIPTDTDANKDLVFYTDLNELVAESMNLVSTGDVRLALIRVKNSIRIDTQNYQTVVMLLHNFNRIQKEEYKDLRLKNAILNGISNNTLEFVKGLNENDLKTK